MKNWIGMLRIRTEKTNRHVLWDKRSVDFEFRATRPAHSQHVPGIENIAVLLGHDEPESDRYAGGRLSHLVAVEDEAVGDYPPRLMDATCPCEATGHAIATFDLDRAAGWRRGSGDTRIRTRENRAEPRGGQIAKDDR